MGVSSEKTISVLKETLPMEKRVIMLPEFVKMFIHNGFKVFIEHNAGMELGFSDMEYKNEGAIIVDTNEAWNCSNLVIKYKCPTENEYCFFREGLTLAAIFHAEGDPRLVKKMCESKMTAYSYEFFCTKEGTFPLAVPGGEVAGKVAFVYALYWLQAHSGGSGILLMDNIGVKKPKVVVIGYGNVGNSVIRIAAKLGNDVVVFGKNSERLRKYAATLDSNVRCLTYDKNVLKEELRDADAVFGAILISTHETEAMIDEELLSVMKKGAIIIDITCGYGSGYMPTFYKKTNLEEPIYEYNGILHCKIDNLPSAYPLTTTKMYLKNAMPYILNFANSYYDIEHKEDISDNGKIIDKGELVHPIVIQQMGAL